VLPPTAHYALLLLLNGADVEMLMSSRVRANAKAGAPKKPG